MTLALWIDPDDSAQVTLSGTRVTTIADKSPAGNDVTEVSTSGPTLGVGVISGRDAMTFSTGDYLTRVNASLTNMNGPDATVFVVVTDDNVVNSFGGIVAMTNAGFTSGWRLIKNTDFEGSFVSQTPRMNAPDSDTAGEAKIIVMQNDETRDYQWIGVDGSWIDAEAQTGTVVWDQDLRIGVNLGSFHYTSGYIGEIIFNDAKLRSDDVQRMEGYLAHKWGNTTSLPAGHPFKGHAPDIVADAVFIANFEGIDGATSYTAETGQVGTFSGNSRIEGDVSKYGGTCYYGDGSSDWVEFPDSADWSFGSGDFTMECWIRSDVTVGDDTVLAHFGASGNYGWLFGFTPGAMRFLWSTTGSDAPQHSVSAGIVPGTWHHIAASREGTTTRLFLDGELLGEDTTISTNSIFDSTEGLAVGNRSNGGTLGFNGRIDGVRIVKGTCLYKGDFTPPHRAPRLPVTAAFIGNFDGLDAATSYTSEDAGARTATFNGNAQLDTAQRKFGVSSLLCDGTGDYVTFPDSPDYEIGADDFSVEAWVRWSADPTTSAETIVGKWTTTGDQREWILDYHSDTIRFGWTTDGTAGTFASVASTTFSPTIDTWYHIRVERADGLIIIWIDGDVVHASANTATFFTGTGTLVVGGNDSGTNDFTGWIDAVRVVKGRGLKSEINSNVPDSVYNNFNDSSTLLLNFEAANGSTTYSSDDANAVPLTFYSGGQISTAQRKIGSASLDAIALPDCAVVPSGNGLALGTGDFTVEFYVYFTSAPSTVNYNAIIDNRVDATSQVRPYIGTNQVSGRWVYYVSSGDRITTTTTPSANQWYHVVLERVNGVTRLYVDGVQLGNDYTDSNNYLDGPWSLGARWDRSNSDVSMEGYLDQVRISVGKAIYKGNFDVPCAAQGEPIV